jgi:two-component system, OmpR family, sensor histidine kinase CiaH
MDRPRLLIRDRAVAAVRAARERLARPGRRMSSPDSALVARVRWRLVAWSGGTTLVVMALLGSALYVAAASSLAASSQHQLETRAGTIEHFVATLSAPRPFRRGDFGQMLALSFGGQAAGTFGYVVLPDGQTFGPPQGPGRLPDQAAIQAARAGGRDVREIDVDGTPYRVLSESVQAANGPVLIQVGQDTTGEHTTLGILLAILLGGGLLGLIGAVAVGAIYADRALIPIRDSLRRQREFAADASHEFRTPLAVIRTSVELLNRHRDEPVRSVGDALGDIDEEVEHLTALVGDLLLLARTDSGVIELERQSLDLSDVCGDALAAVNALAARRDVEIVLDPEPAPVVGDPLRLRQLVTILVDNAIAHSPAHGRVMVSVRSDRGGARLRVEDSGPGLRPEDLPRVFDRFWRASGAPDGGTGLGLAIAAWIVHRHRGTIVVANRSGGGASFEVRLPEVGGA